ncbi:hypothetical protein [endosymbiont GvMRE of Glomus versiforme]|uniref:hypothetical protein n=1 Tax=endosymbiont GvMRE of Glomus versiforme TaxID=2039283 RepID=UPI000ED90C4F|nr:hypothetical protein [endosymbiont GvMRE of Glomus versiforme]RHZ37515.1 hypothetical protein GvMRE_I1g404 [endosymbiont GvMRE of Glomus versiforme]
MTSRLQFLKDLYQKLHKPLTLLEFEEIVDEAKKVIPDDKWQELSQDEQELIISLFWKKFGVYEIFIYNWNSNVVSPTEKELKYLEKYQADFATELLPLFDELKINSSIAETYEKHKQKAVEYKLILDKLLQQEKDCQAGFQTIYQQASNSQTSLSELKNLYNQIGQIVDKYPNFRPSEKTKELFLEILGEFAARLGEFRKNWLEKKLINPTNEELDLFEFFVEELFSFTYEEITNEEEKAQIEREFNQLKDTIHQEKKKRGQSISKDTSGDSSNISKKSQESQKLSQQISELESKVKQLEQEKQPGSNSELENKIKDLQSQIKMLRNELEKTQKGSDKSNKISQNLFGGKSSTTSENTKNDKQPKKEFPWKIVLPLVGIIVLLIGIIIFAFWRKKSKNE